MGTPKANGAAPSYTVTEAIEAQGFGRFHWWMLALCGVCWMADAAELMLLSFLGPVLERDPAWHLAPHEVAVIAAVRGAFFGLGGRRAAVSCSPEPIPTSNPRRVRLHAAALSCSNRHARTEIALAPRC